MSRTMIRIPYTLSSGLVGTMIYLVCPHYVWADVAVANQPLAPSTVSTANNLIASFAGKTILPTDSIQLTLPADLMPQAGQYAIVIGEEDVTGSFNQSSATQLEGVFTDMPLPVGSNTLTLYTISPDNTWLAIGQAKLVVEAAPQVSATYTPSLILGVKSQVHELHSVAATPPNRPTYADGTLQAGLQTDHHTDNWSLKSNINIVGSTYRPDTVNYAAEGSEAPKVDLATYVVDGRVNSDLGVTGLSVGAVSAGNNPLLASGIANRGLLVTHQFNSRIDVSAAAQNGSYIVGRRNISGLSDAQHRLLTATAGVELLPRAGGLRVEASHFQGVVKPTLSTGIATLQDAEESKGWALRTKAQNPSGSLRLDIDFASSTYTPKGDSSLNIAPGPSSLGNTWFADIGYDLLKNKSVGKDLPLSISLSARHEYATANYKSIGAGTGADYEPVN